MNVLSNISEISRIGNVYLNRLAKLGIRTISDLLFYYPRDYQDLSNIRTINEIVVGELNTVKGIILSIDNAKARYSKLKIFKALLGDDTGSIMMVWFNQPYLEDVMIKGKEFIISGKVKFDKGKVSFVSPSFEAVKETQVHTNRIVPVYRETEGVSSKWLRSIVMPLQYMCEQIDDHFDNDFLNRNDLMRLSNAIAQIHFPDSLESLEKAKNRLAFDELFFLQLKALINRIEWQKTNLKDAELVKISLDEKLVKEFLVKLPFELTKDQKISVFQILKDFEKGIPMLRLLEGDVGSGKTVVAAICLYVVVKNGYQGALMAPTEVLVKQHYKTIINLLTPFNINTALLVGSTTKVERDRILEGLQTGTIDVVIGTHSLIQADVKFRKIGFAVIDEQHRFGVEQRSILKEKGNLHLLNMTATPIPRTLLLTICGDQDLSIIEELPKGRKTIITRVIPPGYRKTAELFIADQIKKGRQVFVICPLIEESDVLEVKSVLKEFERLKMDVFKEFRIGLLHGRLKPKEKDEVMDKFKNGEIDILVSTSVVEVGVDIPNASVMVIEGAERFGLAQLHQFRGRVGRSEFQSYCLLFTDNLGETNRKRMKAMVEQSSGFKLAEIDLKLRGPGEVFGVRQSGIPDLRMASLNDKELIAKTHIEAENYLNADPNFEKNPFLKKRLEEFLGNVYSG